MKDKRILYVSSEVIPYLPETEISSMSFEAPRMVNKQGGQIRIFMPRYGNINERRHQLHEVIRAGDTTELYYTGADGEWVGRISYPVAKGRSDLTEAIRYCYSKRGPHQLAVELEF